jgi:hypothetical protein
MSVFGERALDLVRAAPPAAWVAVGAAIVVGATFVILRARAAAARSRA